MNSLLILGRQPELGLAELESLYGADSVQAVGRDAALLELSPADVDFARLGGSIKLAKVLTTLDTTNWKDIEAHLSKTIPEHLQYLPEGKLKLGISSYGLRVRPNEINATGLRLKKVIKAEGRSVRVVPNKSTALNSAQVLHNQLTSPTGWELVLVRNDSETILAQTVAEQDIEAYAKRDQNRPARDAKVGMLPPKLAQTLVNLATGKVEETRDKRPETRILDPFCGTGVLLQEALLMGFSAYGTDIEPRMIEYSQKNLEWLKTSHEVNESMFVLEVGDATIHQWSSSFDAVACETYLGKPLSSLPPRQVLDKIMAECEEIHEKFLRNIGSQLKPGTRLCLAVPAWNIKPQISNIKSQYLHLKTLAKLDELGYTRKKFVHVRDQELIYHRPDQIVARELVVLEKK